MTVKQEVEIQKLKAERDKAYACLELIHAGNVCALSMPSFSQTLWVKTTKITNKMIETALRQALDSPQ